MEYVTLAVLILYLISYSPKKHSTRNHHRRLKLRYSSAHHDPVAFDPLVAEIERRREDNQWEKQYLEHSNPEFLQHPAPAEESQPELDDFLNAEDYLNDGDKFNVTNRLVLLFPKIDVDPSDGFVTENELIEWHLQQATKEVLFRSLREMEVHDRNKDGLISYAEYEAPSWVKNDNPSFGHNMGWWTEDHFNASDADGDRLLKLTEFNDFMHPADSKNPKLLRWLCQEEVRERDEDKDGKVNFNEFFHGIFDFVISHDEEGHDSMETETPAKRLFSQLDKDGDRFLTDEELLPIIGKLHPSERYYAKLQADYIISQADLDKDGRLSLVEMIDNPYVFYSAIFNDSEDNYRHLNALISR
ncbi:hypothetical protein F3Y22_tig00110890pilonHSYRG01498 [Hibiscus syriacus]|uniref:EF-hand domain-containing protein n=1 Tax=Hibiscus syriacus TaxID=106335 RepID=A0A6A2ZHI1_HIBSY|nr:calumenin-like [Hibiscus syriacus]KAE8691464.1 hypothetical protein F3Y22_tig00110890pilonHSYRG01498 [Hibiscus syriacus]